jgi:phospholipid/cholesterol/gamma-HCH transport system substrate-binding protein
MKRSAIITWDQMRVAGIILVALAVLALAAYKLGQAANLFTRRYELIVYLPNANGLRQGGSVTLAGQLVGTVKEIEFLPVDRDTSRNLRVVARIDRSLREQIRRDSEARLRTMGLLGDKVLDISPGTPDFPILEQGDTIRVATALDYEAVLAKAAGAVDDVVLLSQDLRAITNGLARGQGTMGQLLTNRAMYDQLTSAMARANALFANLQNPNGTLGRMLNDPTLYNRLTNTVASLDSTLTAVNSSQGSLGRLLRDTTLYVNLSGIAQGADSLMSILLHDNLDFLRTYDFIM